MNFEDFMPSETSQSQKDKNYDFTYMRSLEESNSQRQKVVQWLPGPVGRGTRELVLMGTEFQMGR